MSRVHVRVVGAGVSGLSCAVRLLENGAGVTVCTAAAPGGTVSAVAGAMCGPVFGSGDERSLAWERRSDAVFRTLVGDPHTGVCVRSGRLLSAPERPPGLPPWAEQVPGFVGELGPQELPAGYHSGFRVHLPIVDMPRYLGWLLRRVGELGGVVEQRVVTDLSEVTGDVIVNCSGLGSRLLADDDSIEPVWGQHVLLDDPTVQEFVYEGGGTADGISVMPQPRGVLVGGVRRPGRTTLTPDPDIVAESVARAARVFPSLSSAEVLGVEVGLRPGRPQVRLESEHVGGRRVVHDYGHDGNGVFWSWGCAEDVVALVHA